MLNTSVCQSCTNTMLAAGDFADDFHSFLVGNVVGFTQQVSEPVYFDSKEAELKSYKELCRVYAKECGRLQNIIHQIPPEILAQYETSNLP